MLKVSIIVPVFNGEKYLNQCIDSAINQTMNSDEYEIILVDDCSTDKSVQIIDSYIKKNRNIRIIKKEHNTGESSSVNTGIMFAKGDYIYVLHQDDMMKNNLLEKCFCVSNKLNLEAVHFGITQIDENHNNKRDEWYYNFGKSMNIITGKDLFEEQFDLGPLYTFFINREFFINKSLFWNDIVFDYYEIFRLCFNINRMIHIDESLYIRRKHDRNISVNFTNGDPRFYYQYYISLGKYCDFIYEHFNGKHYKNIRPYKEFFFLHMRVFISLGNNLIKCDNKKLAIDDINTFIIKYLHSFGDDLEIEDCLNINDYYQKYIKNLKHNNELFAYYIFSNVLDIMERSEKYIYNYKKEILGKIPFNNSSKKIAIYGTGTHTQNMLEFYRNNINKIESQLFFIDSNKGKNGEKYMGIDIINIKDINKYDFDMIVVSSASYENEMIRNIEENTKKDIDVFRFYKDFKCCLF